MNLISGLVVGGGLLRRIWWMVGTAVYQLALCSMKSCQNVVAENFGGTITEPPERRGARNPASSP